MEKIAKKLIMLQNGAFCLFPVAESLPKGWHVIKGATAAPKGYKWINNGCSPFSKDYRHAVIREENIINNQH